MDNLIEHILKNTSFAEALLARAGDKEFILSECKKSFIMFQEKFGYIVALGDPVGSEHTWKDLTLNFIGLAEKRKKTPIFYKIEKLVNLLEERNFIIEKIGEDAVINLDKFSLSGKSKANLRRKLIQANKNKIVFEVIDKNIKLEKYLMLNSISKIWLKSKKRSERGFSVGIMSYKYLQKQVVGVIYNENKPIAFCTANATNNFNEASIDLMRHNENIPNGTMYFLFTQMILYFRSKGFKKMNLCMAPLSGLENEKKTMLNRSMLSIYKNFNHKHGLQGLKQFKNYFSPSWTPKYIATPKKITAHIGVLRLYTIVRDCK